MAILALLWWSWVSYAWLANTAESDEGPVRVVLLAAMGAMLVTSLAVPGAFGDDGVIFGVGYFVVRCLHLVCYVVIARDDPQLLGVIRRLASTTLPAASLLIVAGFLDGAAQAACWGALLLIDFGGLALRGVEGWRVEPGHFAERHGLVIIIALGESIVSVGVGAEGLPLDWELVAGALVAVAVAGALWWEYFDVVSLAAERRIRTAPPEEQVRIARDSYTYLHLPMIAGIILVSVGIKNTLKHVDDHLELIPAVSLMAGAAVYLIALSAFKWRNYGSFNLPRLAVAALFLALIPAALELPALVSLALVASISIALVSFEFERYREVRERIRHAG